MKKYEEMKNYEMTDLFETRYQAEKARKDDPRFSLSDIIVKVCGGYRIMSPQHYFTWKKQK